MKPLECPECRSTRRSVLATDPLIGRVIGRVMICENGYRFAMENGYRFAMENGYRFAMESAEGAEGLRHEDCPSVFVPTNPPQ